MKKQFVMFIGTNVSILDARYTPKVGTVGYINKNEQKLNGVVKVHWLTVDATPFNSEFPEIDFTWIPEFMLFELTIKNIKGVLAKCLGIS